MTYIDVVDLGAYMGIDTDALGWRGEFAVRAAEDAVAGVLDRTITLVEDDEVTLDGTGTSSLLLQELPVIDVSLVTESGSVLTEDVDYVVGEHGILYRVPPSVWRKGVRNVGVTYSHGYSTIGDDDGNEMPMVVREAALSYAKEIYEGGIAPPAGITSETLGPYSYSANSAEGRVGAAKGALAALEAKLAGLLLPRPI